MKTNLKIAATTLLVTTAIASYASHADGSRGFRTYAPAAPVYSAPVHGAPTAYGYAHGGHPLVGLNEIRARQSELIARIERGFHRGSITRWEYRRLMSEQHDISAMERAFVADGLLTPRECAELHRRLDIAAQHIFVESHDAQRRYW